MYQELKLKAEHVFRNDCTIELFTRNDGDTWGARVIIDACSDNPIEEVDGYQHRDAAYNALSNQLDEVSRSESA